MQPAWDFAALQAWFAARPGQDILESDLLRAFFPETQSWGIGLELFQKHFLLYRRLWLFDDELRMATGERLWIRGIRSTLLVPAPDAHCGWLNPETGRYCLAPAPNRLCALHQAPLPETNSMKSYYLDWRNLEGMTEEGLNNLVDGFFRWMGNQPAVADALEVLGLSPEADARSIKARWRQLSLEHHPDRGGDPAYYQKLSAAWTALKALG